MPIPTASPPASPRGRGAAGVCVLLWVGALAGPGVVSFSAPAAASSPVPASEIPLKGPYRYERGWYHKVQMGDTLPVLANRFGVELKYLAQSNGLKPDSFLVMGSHLYIPPHSGFYHRALKGDTLEAVARRYHLDLDYLAAANRVGRTTRLREGEILIIPTRTRPAPIPDPPSATSRAGASSSSKASRGGSSVSGLGSGVRSSGSTSSGSTSGSGGRGSSSSSASSSSSSLPSSSIAGGSSGRSSVAGMVQAPTERIELPTPGGGERGGSSGSGDSPGASRSVSGSTASSSSWRGASSGSSASYSSSRSGGGSSSPASSASGSSSGSSPRGAISPRRSSDGRPALQWPLEGTVTRTYVNKPDQKHRGVDLAAPKGTAIRAAADGTVVYSGNDIPGYGNMVIVDHGRGWATCYAHNAENRVKKDQRVGAGQTVATVGESGHATGPHCHFEVRYKYEAVDPMPLLP